MSRRRDDHSEEHEAGQERWLVSYADFITLMFAFFTILYATSEKDLSKAKEFEESLKKYMIKAGAAGVGESTVNQAQNQDAVIEPPIKNFRKQKPEEATDSLNETEKFIEASFTPQERKAFIQDVSSDDWGIRIAINSETLFAGESDKFNEDAIKLVSKIGELILKSKNKVMIEGHVAQNDKGNYRSTWDFSAARAINVLRFIEAKYKLPPSRLLAASFGDSRPVHSTQTKLNSRIEIVFLNQDLDL